MISESKIIALIPARGGSKSIPRKNIYPVAGKPLIAHSIRQALESKYISRVIVSTDDEEIADVSRQWGAEVPFMRPAEFSQDQSLDIEVFDHALRWLKKNEAYEPELVVHLRPTGYSSFLTVTLHIARDVLLKVLNKPRLLRARAHQAHVAKHHVY